LLHIRRRWTSHPTFSLQPRLL